MLFLPTRGHEDPEHILITESEVVPLLRKACPTAEGAWKKHLGNWDGEEAGYYNDVGVFVDHIVESYAAGKTDECAEFFSVVEKMILDGNKEVHGLAIVGIIETVQNVASHQPFGNSVFKQWLGPKSQQGWQETEELWKGKSSLMDVIRAERASEDGK